MKRVEFWKLDALNMETVLKPIYLLHAVLPVAVKNHIQKLLRHEVKCNWKWAINLDGLQAKGGYRRIV